MSVQGDKVTPRKRKAPPRRAPAIIEERERQPFMFGRGHNLTRHEREAIKERIALFGGIALAIVLAIILGYGWLQDNVITPARLQAENSKPVAIVGKDTIHMGLFKHYEKFEQTQLTAQQQQVAQQLSTLQANPKKNAASISQLQAQDSAIQQQLGSISSNALTALIQNDTMLQRSASAGVPVTPKLVNAAMTGFAQQEGGHQHMIDFINQSGLSYNEFKNQIIVANALQTKLQSKLAASVPHYQTKVRASHILVPTSKKALAVRLYHETLGGANFATLARKYSIDTASAKKGGDLGYFAHGAMVPAFDKAAFAMKVGQIRLIHSQYGWHIIKVTGREHARLTPTEYQQQQQTALQSWYGREEAQLHVERLVAPASLPNPAGAQNSLTNITQTQPQAPAPAPAPAPVTGTHKTGKTTKGTKNKP